MKVLYRNPSLSYPMAIKHDKMLLVLDWLLEFRFSSIELLAERLESNATNSHRFFAGLLKEGIIQRFKNVHTLQQNYVMLTSAGVSILEAFGRDVSRATTRVKQLGRYSQILHDIGVQWVCMKKLRNFDEVVWDRHIDLPDSQERPDLLMRSPKNYWVAVEYERWRKDTKRIYITFHHHALAITARRYSGVIFVYDQAQDLAHYKKLFDAEAWPIFKREPKSGRVLSTATSYKPDDVTNLRKCFVFELQ